MKADQYRKKGIALMMLAKKFYLFKEGDRIPTVDEFCEEINFSRGTVQGALATLKRDGAIRTVSRGHLGTFLESIDQDKLISYVDNRNLVCAMPLPYTKYYEGLATGLYQLFADKKLHLSLAYMSGSLNRLDGLLSDRYDFIITSGITADSLLKQGEVEEAMSLPRHTYLSEHVILFPKGAPTDIRDGMKIGVDSHSLDYAILTDLILKKHQVQLIETPYNQIVHQVETHAIDAAIWNRDEVQSRNEQVSFRSIELPIIERGSQAVILCKKGNDFIKRVLAQYIDVQQLVQTQRGVIAGTILPEY